MPARGGIDAGAPAHAAAAAAAALVMAGRFLAGFLRRGFVRGGRREGGRNHHHQGESRGGGDEDVSHDGFLVTLFGSFDRRSVELAMHTDRLLRLISGLAA